MKKYDEYKDSGVAWIGEVPKHWEILRGKYVLKILSGFPFDSQKFEFEDNGVYMPLIRIRDINCSSTEVYYSGSYPIESVVKTGEVLIGMDGDFNISKWKGTNALLNQRVCKLREDSSMNTHYAFYMLSSPLKAINSVTYATTVKHLSVYDIYNAFIPVPPISEQAAISTYLDTHCAKIDNLISIQQKRIALLQELKQSVITHAVTKGLNPNVEMKQSGVKWIGDVPKHWKILRGKYVLNILSGFPFDSQKFEFEDNGVYMPLIRIRDINCSSTEVYYSGSYPIESVVKTGEVLIGMDGDFNISKWKGTNALLNQRVCKLREDSSMNTHYAFYMLSSPLKAINSVTYATTVKHLSVYDIYNVFIPVPPIPEQAAIASYLDHKCATIDTSISNAQHQIDLLQEYKQSLITEVVTGKRKVTDN